MKCTWYTKLVRSFEVSPRSPLFRSTLDALKKLCNLPPLTYSRMTNVGSRSVQQPKSRTIFWCGSRLFITFSSCTKSSLSLSVAFSFSVFTATIVVPNDVPISQASHFHTCPKQPSPRILKTYIFTTIIFKYC
jgi:hypothetical protein